MNEKSNSEIASAWVSLQYADEASESYNKSFWAYSRFEELRKEDVERYWKILNEIVKVDDSDLVLANLAAGPLEDLLVQHGSEFIDRVEMAAKTDPRYMKMLAMVWRNNISDEVWQRIQRTTGRNGPH